MNLEDDNVIGIVGGMGPQAGLALLNNVIFHTKAREDQQHLSAILMSFPKYIVDRTSFLEGVQHVNPAFNIVEIIKKLENAGAKIVGIACNTSHSPEIYDVILEELDKVKSQVKLLNMPFETCKYILKNHSNIHRVGLMTTNGTYKSAIYRKMLESFGYEVVIPDFKFQNEVIHKMIYDKSVGIKSNSSRITTEARQLMAEALRFFKKNETEAIVLGCTELSLILTEDRIDNMIIVDSTEKLAKALIREAIEYKRSDGSSEIVASPYSRVNKY